jgi:hypothetical protein
LITGVKIDVTNLAAPGGADRATLKGVNPPRAGGTRCNSEPAVIRGRPR